MRKFVFTVVAFFPLLQPVWPDADNSVDSQRSYTIRRLEQGETIRIDGQFSEPAWARAEVATDFITKVPREHEPATQNTEVRMLYDEKNIYIDTCGENCISNEFNKFECTQDVRPSED
jgi:hypothetical protein